MLIIGGGIAGPALAAALYDRDCSVTVLERSDAPLDTARGDHLQPRTLEILEQWGVLSLLLDAGAEPRRGTRWFDEHGDALLTVDLSGLELPHPTYRFLNHERISQVLLDGAARNPRFEMICPIRRWRLTSPGTVKVEQRNQPPTEVHYRLLIGADGSASGVRRALGIDAEVHRYTNPIGVLFGRSTVDNPDNDLLVCLGEERIIAAIPRTGGCCKVGLPLKRDELDHWRGLDAGGLRRALHRLAPSLALDDLRFDGLYPPTRVLAQRWTGERAALVGDACHAMHPARSQGMNIAVQNIHALLERLPRNVTEWTDASLEAALAHYDGETRPAMEQRLQDNHQAGLAMDAMSGEANAMLKGRLMAVAADASIAERHALAAAGYA
ncbi:MAG: NAD(P)/FAD-dependent oxidoreductase [Pseudomonadota bacterium]